MKKHIVSIVILLFSITLFAQETEEQSKTLSKHAVGAAAGPTIGCGLAYQYTYSKFSVQLTFLPYKKPQEELYCVGLSFYYTLNQGQKTSLFLYQGNHFYYHKKEGITVSWENHRMALRMIDAFNNNSLGIGFGFKIFDNVSLKLMSGYAAYNNFTNLSLTGEIALLYHIPSK